ncbi:hypothetical protein GCM10027258_01750 [Amycolatopsis stemonae]
MIIAAPSEGIFTKGWPFTPPAFYGDAVRHPRREELPMTETLESWSTPDFVEYETPMEVTAYAARMED